MSDRSTVYVEDPPRRMLGNVLIDGPDGQCVYIYAGIGERCTNDAVAHTYMEHGGESVRVEMCAEHAREDVPETPTTEQAELVTDGGVDRELGFELTHYRLGVIDLYLHDWAEGTRLYTSAGETSDVEEMADHDGPVILEGKFRHIERDGTIVAWHPHAGYCCAFGPDETTDQPAVLLTEVDRDD